MEKINNNKEDRYHKELTDLKDKEIRIGNMLKSFEKRIEVFREKRRLMRKEIQSASHE